MSARFRLLVTGSRDWSDADRIWGALSGVLDQGHDALTIVHGDASRGADLIARRWVLRQQAYGRTGITEERHPARWDELGRRAGMVRNAEMVRSGLDACFAWIMPCTAPGCGGREPHGSHGASGCADLAEKAGIDTRRWFPHTAARS